MYLQVELLYKERRQQEKRTGRKAQVSPPRANSKVYWNLLFLRSLCRSDQHSRVFRSQTAHFFFIGPDIIFATSQTDNVAEVILYKRHFNQQTKIDEGTQRDKCSLQSRLHALAQVDKYSGQ